jgi:hypothetical protein
MGSLKYGFNFMTSDIKNQLERNDVQQNGVRSWNQLFGGASLKGMAQTDATTSYYSTAMSDAYKTHLGKSDAIVSAGLNKNMTNNLLGMNRQDLQNTYDTYLGNYGKSLGAINTSYANEVSTIDAGLTERADNFKRLYESAYKYMSDELVADTSVVGSPDYLADNKLNWAKRPDGTILPWEELSLLLFSADGELNERGTEFFDKMINARPEGATYQWTDEDGNVHERRPFDQWLSDKDPDLREWMLSPDVFDYTRQGSNLGTAKTKVGMESDDDTAPTYEHSKLDTVVGALKLSDFSSKNENYVKASTEPKVRFSSEKKKADKERVAAWATYREAIRTEVTSKETELRSLLGTDAYNEFVADGAVASLKSAIDGILTVFDMAKDAPGGTKDAGQIDFLNYLLKQYEARMIGFAKNVITRRSASGY